ncbi:hypothetical protein FRC00_001255 [Tulasnella sp. 408]|nr:hypothetical protein FRC00_001255 [Tulasnella sp. 408]
MEAWHWVELFLEAKADELQGGLDDLRTTLADVLHRLGEMESQFKTTSTLLQEISTFLRLPLNGPGPLNPTVDQSIPQAGWAGDNGGILGQFPVRPQANAFGALGPQGATFDPGLTGFYNSIDQTFSAGQPAQYEPSTYGFGAIPGNRQADLGGHTTPGDPPQRIEFGSPLGESNTPSGRPLSGTNLVRSVFSYNYDNLELVTARSRFRSSDRSWAFGDDGRSRHWVQGGGSDSLYDPVTLQTPQQAIRPRTPHSMISEKGRVLAQDPITASPATQSWMSVLSGLVPPGATTPKSRPRAPSSVASPRYQRATPRLPDSTVVFGDKPPTRVAKEVQQPATPEKERLHLRLASAESEDSYRSTSVTDAATDDPVTGLREMGSSRRKSQEAEARKAAEAKKVEKERAAKTAAAAFVASSASTACSVAETTGSLGLPQVRRARSASAPSPAPSTGSAGGVRSNKSSQDTKNSTTEIHDEEEKHTKAATQVQGAAAAGVAASAPTATAAPAAKRGSTDSAKVIASKLHDRPSLSLNVGPQSTSGITSSQPEGGSKSIPPATPATALAAADAARQTPPVPLSSSASVTETPVPSTPVAKPTAKLAPSAAEPADETTPPLDCVPRMRDAYYFRGFTVSFQSTSAE